MVLDNTSRRTVSGLPNSRLRFSRPDAEGLGPRKRQADSHARRIGLDPDDFDVVFAYPWPGEERLIESLFEKYAAEEALLLMYNKFNSVRLRRKVGKRSGGF